MSNGPRWINKPQFITLIPDLFMFMAGGMNLAVGLGWNFLLYNRHFQYCWFIGVIAGAILVAPLTTFLPKRYCVLISSFLVTVAAVIFSAAPFNLAAMITARYIDGVGIGFATVPFIVHASEIAAKSNRAFCLGIEQLGIALGICVQTIYTSQWTAQIGFSANRLHGILCLVFGMIALGTAYLVIESPIFYIRKHDAAAALDALTRLQRPDTLTDEKKRWFYALQEYVRENEQLACGESFGQCMAPLAKMLLHRSLLAFSYSLPFNQALYLCSVITIGSPTAWPMILYGVLRMLGTLCAWPVLDVLGRKAISAASLLVVGGLTIGVACVFAPDGHSDHTLLGCDLLLTSQVFDGIFAPTTTTYLGEAFPLRWKPYGITLCVAVQYAVHIVVICTFTYTSHDMYVYSSFAYAYMLLGFVLLVLILPETGNTTLAEAQARFRNWLNLKLY